MLRKSKIVGGSALAAAAVVGVAVPAYAATSTPAPSTSTPTTTAKHPGGHHGARHGMRLLGFTPAVIAKAAGTDAAGLKAGRQAGKSLTQIAAGHSVTRATLLSRLDAIADAKLATLINAKLPTGKGRNASMPKPSADKDAPKAGTHPEGKGGGPRAHGPRGLRGVPGLRTDYKGLASTLKVTPAQLTAALKKGQTLQQVATAHKVSTATLLGALDKDVNAALAKAVDRVPHAKKAPATN